MLFSIRKPMLATQHLPSVITRAILVIGGQHFVACGQRQSAGDNVHADGGIGDQHQIIGIGIDVTPVMKDVVNAAVERAYGSQRSVEWMEVYAGGKATERYGADDFLPDETLDALKQFVVSIKGPLMTPTGGGCRNSWKGWGGRSRTGWRRRRQGAG